MDIFHRAAKARGWEAYDANNSSETPAEKLEEQRAWNDVMKQLHEPFEILCEAVSEGLEHAGIALEFSPRPAELKKKDKNSDSTKADVESSAGLLRPGEKGFAKVVKAKLDTFYSRKKDILQAWAREKGLFGDSGEKWNESKTNLLEKRRADQSQLYMLLYMEKLVGSVSDPSQLVRVSAAD